MLFSRNAMVHVSRLSSSVTTPTTRRSTCQMYMNIYHRMHTFSTSTRPLSKVVGSAKEALEGIDLKGATVAVGGFGLVGNPETLLQELSITKTASDLTVASLTGGNHSQRPYKSKHASFI